MCVAAIVWTAIVSNRIDRRYPADGAHADVGDVSLHYWDNETPGDRLPLVLVHGASANLYDSLSAAGNLFEGRRIIAIDRPGHGHSSRPNSEMADPSGQASVIADLLGDIGVTKAIIVGHSLGAAVTAAFAVHYPERTAGLVFIAPATHVWPGGVTWYYRLATIPLIGRLFVWTIAIPVGLQSMKSASGEVFAPDPMPKDYVDTARIALVLRPRNFIANAEDVVALKKHVAAMSPRYREIDCPTVILTGDRDTIVWPSIHSEGLKRDIRGARLIVAEGSGHRPHHSRRDLFAEAVTWVTNRASDRES